MQKWRTRPRSHVGLESDVSHRSWPLESQQVPYGGPWMAMGPLRSQGITTSIEDSPGSLSSVNRELFHPEFQLPKVQGDVIRACLGISGLHPSNISNHVFPTCDSRFPTEAAMDAAYQLLPRSVFWGPKNQNHNFKTYHLVI